MARASQLPQNVFFVAVALAFVLLVAALTCVSATSDPDEEHTFGEKNLMEIRRKGRTLVRSMIDHAMNNYLEHAFPMDELAPQSCTGVNTLGNYSLTLIDSLDLLAIVGRHNDFRRFAAWVAKNVHFDRDVNVSVFETHIRVVGGLLSAHFMYEEGIVEVVPAVDDYDGALLRLAIDVADRLLPAFNTPTGIPFGTVNLKYGVPKDEVDVTSTASAGTFLLEMSIISSVTGDPKYVKAARRAAYALFHRRGGTQLPGNHINITSGLWTLLYTSPGSGVDSYIEYLLKTYILTEQTEYLSMFQEIYNSLLRYSRKGPWYVDIDMNSGVVVNPLHNSLSSFYPGALALAGYLQEARESAAAVHTIFRRYGALPEGYNLLSGSAQERQTRYPLRPEHAESLYVLLRATGDPVYEMMGYEVLVAVNTRTYAKCGFAVVEDVEQSLSHSNHMESFVLSETLKYLFLLFYPESPVHVGVSAVHEEPTNALQWVFNTEGHPFPLTDEWVWPHPSSEDSPANSRNIVRPLTYRGQRCPRHSISDEFTAGETALFSRTFEPLFA